jgi:hypothetical protein
MYSTFDFCNQQSFPCRSPFKLEKLCKTEKHPSCSGLDGADKSTADKLVECLGIILQVCQQCNNMRRYCSLRKKLKVLLNAACGLDETLTQLNSRPILEAKSFLFVASGPEPEF